MRMTSRMVTVISVPIVCTLLLGWFTFFKKPIQIETAKYIGVQESVSIPLEKYLIKKPGKEKRYDIKLKLITVLINGIECRLILDTGASQTVLFKEFCKEHSIVGKKIRIDKKTSDVKVDQAYEANVQLELNKMQATVLPVMVLKNPFIVAEANVHAVGILGSDYLNQYIYSVNMQDDILRFIPEADYPNVASGVEVPIEIRHNLIYFMLDIEGKLVEFILDTGRTISQVNKSDFKHKEIKHDSHKSLCIDINGQRLLTTDIIELTNIRFGSLQIVRADFSAMDENIIGANILELNEIIINPKKKRMIISRGK